MLILLLISSLAHSVEIAPSTAGEAATKRTENLLKTAIPDLVVDEFTQDGEVTIDHLREKFIHEVNTEQAALDTQAEYSRMQLQCLPAGHSL